DPSTGSPFPNNLIPASRIDPVAQTLIKLYPTPQNASVATNFTYVSPAIQNWSKYDIRGDLNLGTKDTMFWRYSIQNQTVPSASATTTLCTEIRRTGNWQATWCGRTGRTQ